MKKALFLAGGGARGAYQAGVLKGISDILKTPRLPFQIISSISVGSINAAFLARYADDFALGTQKLVDLWNSLKCENIYKTGNFALLKSVWRNIFNMVFHRKIKGGQYLLDTEPLRELLNDHIDFNLINKHIQEGLLHFFEVAAVCYDRAETVSFYHSTQPSPQWHVNRQISQMTDIQLHHVMASSAIPLFFPAIEINSLHYGDGGLRNTSPLRAALKFDADAILMIGTRRLPTLTAAKPIHDGSITFAKILSNMLDAAFVDNIEQNMESIHKINLSLEKIPSFCQQQLPWRKIDLLYMHPNADLGRMAEKQRSVIPLLLRYLLNVFGTKEQPSDILSFLLFEGEYCKEIMELGYNDAVNQRAQIELFFSR